MARRGKRKTGSSSARNAENKRARVEKLLRRAAQSGAVPRPGHEEQSAAMLERVTGELEGFDMEKLVRMLSLVDDPEVTDEVMERRALEPHVAGSALTVLRTAVEEELRSRGVDPGAVRVQRDALMRVPDGEVRANALEAILRG